MDRRHRSLHASCRTVAMVLMTIVGNASRVRAHEGPPFPILMDQPAEDYRVSVWADPDIGEATFFIIVEAPGGGPPATPPKEVSMWARPVSGRLDRVTYETERQDLRNQLQFEAQPYFDQRDMWTVGFRVVSPGGRSEEFTTEVESTPPGYGPWDLIVYLFPFVLLAGLWAVAMVRRYRARAQSSQGNSASDDNVAHQSSVQATSGTAARPDPAWTSEHARE